MRILLLLLVFSFPLNALGSPQMHISCNNVRSIRYAKLQELGWDINISLNRDGTETLKKTTTEHLGEIIEILARGRTLSRIQARAIVTSGRMAIRTESEEQAQQYIDLICPAKLAPPPGFEIMDREPHLMKHPERFEAPPFPVDCSQIEKMEVWLVQSFDWGTLHDKNTAYSLVCRMTKSRARDLVQAVKTVEPTSFSYGTGASPRFLVQFTAHGRKITSDAPTWDGYSNSGSIATFTFRTLERALEAAETICPAKVPKDLMLDIYTAEPIPATP